MAMTESQDCGCDGHMGKWRPGPFLCPAPNIPQACKSSLEHEVPGIKITPKLANWMIIGNYTAKISKGLASKGYLRDISGISPGYLRDIS